MIQANIVPACATRDFATDSMHALSRGVTRAEERDMLVGNCHLDPQNNCYCLKMDMISLNFVHIGGKIDSLVSLSSDDAFKKNRNILR